MPIAPITFGRIAFRPLRPQRGPRLHSVMQGTADFRNAIANDPSLRMERRSTAENRRFRPRTSAAVAGIATDRAGTISVWRDGDMWS
jgi:hypothetical protein